jgi:hypothetical protein
VKPRFPFQTEKGGWSDIDVLAYQPEEQWLVIGESKVRGPKDAIYAYISDPDVPDRNIFSFDDAGYLGFLKHVGRISTGRDVFQNFEKMVKRLTIKLVSNYLIVDEDQQSVVKTVLDSVQPDVPRTISLDVRLETILDVVCRIIREEHKSGQGRRYGHPILDLAREINRYMHPSIQCAGRDRQTTTAIRKALEEKLIAALRGS